MGEYRPFLLNLAAGKTAKEGSNDEEKQVSFFGNIGPGADIRIGSDGMFP
jgi:hypothetical protein